MLAVPPRKVAAHYARYGMLAIAELDAGIEEGLNRNLMAYGHHQERGVIILAARGLAL